MFIHMKYIYRICVYIYTVHVIVLQIYYIYLHMKTKYVNCLSIYIYVFMCDYDDYVCVCFIYTDIARLIQGHDLTTGDS